MYHLTTNEEKNTWQSSYGTGSSNSLRKHMFE